MQVYLVGGAVRDELLGRAVTERDWVVVGGTPADMERAGYRPVGREFPVFLHPQTNEEYALARLERKTGPGYRGFTMQFSPEVTLEEDLLRRDLTINAMARSPEGTLIDPYGGRKDLHERQLRHVSAAFVEDPVRVLRVARFAARFAELGFRVAPETYSLMRAMVANGEVAALVPERVWQELERALREPSPEVFFDTLQDCGALAVLLPELRWQAADRDALRAVVPLSGDTSVRFAALGAGSAEAGLAALCERRIASSRCYAYACSSASRPRALWMAPGCSSCSRALTLCVAPSVLSACCAPAGLEVRRQTLRACCAPRSRRPLRSHFLANAWRSSMVQLSPRRCAPHAPSSSPGFRASVAGPDAGSRAAAHQNRASAP